MYFFDILIMTVWAKITCFIWHKIYSFLGKILFEIFLCILFLAKHKKIYYINVFFFQFITQCQKVSRGKITIVSPVKQYTDGQKRLAAGNYSFFKNIFFSFGVMGLHFFYYSRVAVSMLTTGRRIWISLIRFFFSDGQ